MNKQQPVEIARRRVKADARVSAAASACFAPMNEPSGTLLRCEHALPTAHCLMLVQDNHVDKSMGRLVVVINYNDGLM
jgi:hypothetical protein